MSALKEVIVKEALSTVSPEVFRQGMAGLPAAVNIVTTNTANGPAGFTATAVCSVSDNPATILVCLNRSTSVHTAFIDSTSLVINALNTGQDQLSNLFAGKASMEDRFASAQWETLKTGAPVLSNAAVSFDCKITHRESVGTHDVIFCQVVDIKQQDNAGSLLYFQRGYHHLPTED